VHGTVLFTVIFFNSELKVMSMTEGVKVRKLALPPIILYGLAGTLIILGVIFVLLGWYGSTTLTDGRWNAFTILYAYWLTRRIMGILVAVGIFILVGTYMVHRAWVVT